MMKSYFFIPASRLRKLGAIKKLAPNSIIIDFEDAILSTDIDVFFEELKGIADVASNWFRIPVRDNFKEKLNFDYLQKFSDFGVEFIVLPKIKTAAELIEVITAFKNIKFIILIEHPRLLLEMEHVLMFHSEILESIVGVGVGSHDLMTFLKASHTVEQLDFPRKKVLYLAKAYDLIAIDIASMNIFNEEAFNEEVIYAQNNGYDGKFVIHPIQLTWLQNEIDTNEASLIWAQSILKHLPNNYNGEDVVPFVLNNEVIEKPHALRALEIVKKYNYGK